MSYSSNEYSIKVSNLSKSYLMYDKPQHRFYQMLTRNRKTYYKEFWANKNISLSIKQGSTFGIIGENGSGKSTLLQMICGTLNPTAGQIEVTGKVAALLELGAGFNPEFTGRENVYMSASLYGLTKDEVDNKFSDIEKFADIGEHIEQPVKNYSSGMYVRLAFAVIAHVDADILVIDEALSVGDAIFQQKCMRFIRQFQKKGTLLFVSHDMGSVLNLCENAIWLEKGEIRQSGSAKEIAEAYLKHSLQQVYGNEAQLENVESPANVSEKIANKNDPTLDYDSINEFEANLDEAKGWTAGGGEIVNVQVMDSTRSLTPVFKGNDEIIIKLQARLDKDMANPILGFIVKDRLGQDIFGENTLPFTAKNITSSNTGDTISAEFRFIMPFLQNGQYLVMASLAEGDQTNNIQHHYLHDAAIINVSNSQVRWGLAGVKFLDVKLKKEKL